MLDAKARKLNLKTHTMVVCLITICKTFTLKNKKPCANSREGLAFICTRDGT